MGYNTDFFGEIELDRPLTVEHRNALEALATGEAPADSPGSWCQWGPTENGTAIEWDGNEKFRDYEEWLAYILDSFIKPWGYVANGEIEWHGDEWDDIGRLCVADNVLTIKQGAIVFGDDGETSQAVNRLHDAAPELLAACNKLLDAISDLSDDARTEFDEAAALGAIAAIAKATGGEAKGAWIVYGKQA